MSSIAVDDVTKRFGRTTALDGLSFQARAGRVTGFLGRNGAGKTTTLHVLVGFVAPDRGVARIDGRLYGDLREPLRTVGVVLEGSTFHPSRSARQHLHAIAMAARLGERAVDRVIERTGLGAVADHAVRRYSLGMRRRLGLATALLGDPRVLLLDEPVNGLDPQGMRWLRGFLRDLASEGRVVLMSSHALSEVGMIVDDVVIIERGRLVHAGSAAELTDGARSLEDAFIELTGAAAGIVQ